MAEFGEKCSPFVTNFRLILVRLMKPLVVIALLPGSLAAQARPVHATIYFRGWYAESFVAVSPQGLRDMAHSFPSIRRTVSGEALASLQAVLDLQHLHSERGLCSQDTNLVVDFFEGSDGQHSYRADGLYLCSIENSSSRRTDKRFLKYFENMFPEPRNRPNQMLKRTVTRREVHIQMSKTVSVEAELGDRGLRSSCISLGLLARDAPVNETCSARCDTLRECFTVNRL